jgi:hypothetical protein
MGRIGRIQRIKPSEKSALIRSIRALFQTFELRNVTRWDTMIAQ